MPQKTLPETNLEPPETVTGAAPARHIAAGPHDDLPAATGTAKPAPAPASPQTAAPHSTSPTALQDQFLNGLRRENIDVVLYFCDGTQERGTVRAFDTFTILLENRSTGKAQLVYKHAIARIFPTRTPSLLLASDRAKK